MEIILKNKIKQIFKIINQKSKFQKVLLLYDNSVSNLEINEIHSSIKDLCIFNKMNINDIDEKEFYNGYRALIFLCSPQSMLNIKLNREDFINIYCPTTNFLLPFFCNNHKLLTKDCFIVLNNASIDTTLLSSCYFNNFCINIENLINAQHSYSSMQISNELTLFSLVDYLNNNQLVFKDLEIAQESNIDLEYLTLLQLLIINAFILFFSAINNNELSLIDCVKATKHNPDLIDKYFAKVFNNDIYNSIIINYDYLNKMALSTKESILKCLYLKNFTIEQIDSIINKTKLYLKNCDGIFSYLYLFNIFGN